MVTIEEAKQLKTVCEADKKTAYQVTGSELSGFIDMELELADLVSERKKRYEKENGITATQAYLDIEEFCQISTDTFKKAMCNARKITRPFLYKFTVGFRMNEEEANEYFELCGGPLSRKRADDYICLNALRDGDTVQQLVDDFEKHLNLKIGYNAK